MKTDNKLAGQVFLGVVLIALSVFFYFLHYLIFHDPHHIFIYLVGDVAFVPIEVLLVSLIIHRLLEQREKRRMLYKMNMVIGVFFSEVGTELLRYFKDFHKAGENSDILFDSDWTEEDFDNMIKLFEETDYDIDLQKGDIGSLKEFAKKKRFFLAGLLQNPNLLEHNEFTDVLWAVFHLFEELSNREQTDELPPTDKKHLAGDIKRAYKLLVGQWLQYLKHLQQDYPYLFSLAVRTNPYNPNASPEVEK